MAEETRERRVKPGTRFGRFEVIEHLASGGMGSVFRARDLESKDIVALKVLSRTMAGNPDMVERFRREAKAADKLHHENVVELLDFGEAGGTFYLAMEFVDGTDLHSFIHDHPEDRVSLPVALRILTQAAKALDAAHRLGIVHRDVKPANFLISGDGESVQVKLADFGLAREVDDEEFRITKAGKTLGTVDYMSPEQARDSGNADIRSDLYSLGCTFFHMLAGRAPFNTGTLPERILQHLQSPPPNIRHINAAVPDRIAHILEMMLEKKPADRYQTPWDLLLDLEPLDRLRAYLKQHPEIANQNPPLRAGRHAGEWSDAGEGVLPDEIGMAGDDIPPLKPMEYDSPRAERPVAAPPKPQIKTKPDTTRVGKPNETDLDAPAIKKKKPESDPEVRTKPRKRRRNDDETIPTSLWVILWVIGLGILAMIGYTVISRLMSSPSRSNKKAEPTVTWGTGERRQRPESPPASSRC
ncbi:MAG: serine/threonine protein kinase [Gemmataceae bacterium]|nr:serine/threonine protein kinase [Gemmataceae bacterium]